MASKDKDDKDKDQEEEDEVVDQRTATRRAAIEFKTHLLPVLNKVKLSTKAKQPVPNELMSAHLLTNVSSLMQMDFGYNACTKWLERYPFVPVLLSQLNEALGASDCLNNGAIQLNGIEIKGLVTMCQLRDVVDMAELGKDGSAYPGRGTLWPKREQARQPFSYLNNWEMVMKLNGGQPV